MDREFELEMAPGSNSEHSMTGSKKSLIEEDTGLTTERTLPEVLLTSVNKETDRVNTPTDYDKLDDKTSRVTKSSLEDMASISDIHQHNIGVDRSPRPKKLDLLSVPEANSPTDSVQSTDSGANNNMAGWAKLRTTVKVAGVVNAKTKKKRKVSGVSRQDSFMKRFSTRYQTRNSLGSQDSEEESAAGTLLSKARIPAEIEDKKPFVVNPDGVFMFYWLAIVTVAVLYNLWTCIAREAFTEIVEGYEVVWFVMDGFCDFFYLVDICVQLRTGYLERGLVVYNSSKLAKHYTYSRFFVIDVLSLLPLDIIQFHTGIHPLLRFPRFIKVYRAYRFSYMVETRTVYPNMWRVANLSHLLFLGSHWFAAFYYMISAAEDFKGSWGYPKPEGVFTSVKRKYLKSLYWSTLTLTTIGDLPPPEKDEEYVFTICSYLIGVFVFATIVGQVGNVITNRNASRQEFERLLDGAKAYMRNHNVPMVMQRRVQRWYDYAWSRGRVNGGGDINSLGLLPDKLKTELALHVNLETLKKVTIFQECEPEFLHDLVLKMKAYIFTPGDLICRKGEVAREMFIIADGLLEVISDSGEVLTQMGTGDFFGEIGILNLDGGVNRRTADVRSVGYSELFVLSREDVLCALKDHPEAEAVIKKCAQRRLKELNVYNRRNVKEKEARLHNASTPASTGGVEEMAESSLNLLTNVTQVGKDRPALANGPSKVYVQQNQQNATKRHYNPRSLLQKLLPFKSSYIGGQGLYQRNMANHNDGAEKLGGKDSGKGLQRRLSKSYSHLEDKTRLGDTEAEIEPLIMSPSLNNVTTGTQSSDLLSRITSSSLQPLIHVQRPWNHGDDNEDMEVSQSTGFTSSPGDNEEGLKNLPVTKKNDIIISVESLEKGGFKSNQTDHYERSNNNNSNFMTLSQFRDADPTVDAKLQARSSSERMHKSRNKDRGVNKGGFKHSSLRNYMQKEVQNQKKWSSDKLGMDFQQQADHVRLEIPFLTCGSDSISRSRSEAQLTEETEQRFTSTIPRQIWPQTHLCAHSTSQSCLHCLPKLKTREPSVAVNDCDTSVGDASATTPAHQSTMQHSTSLTFTRPSHRHTIHGPHSSSQLDPERRSRASLPNALVVAGLENSELQATSGELHNVCVDQEDDSTDEEELSQGDDDTEVMTALQLILHRKLARYKEKYTGQIEYLKRENRSKEDVISELQHQLNHLQTGVDGKLQSSHEELKQKKTNSRVRWMDDAASIQQPGAVPGNSLLPKAEDTPSVTISEEDCSVPQVLVTDDSGEHQHIP